MALLSGEDPKDAYGRTTYIGGRGGGKSTAMPSSSFLGKPLEYWQDVHTILLHYDLDTAEELADLLATNKQAVRKEVDKAVALLIKEGKV